MAWVPFGIPEQLCTAVSNVAGLVAAMGRLAVHPYNQDDKDQSVWWLFRRGRGAGDNWPAYDNGKIFFDKPYGRGAMRVGLYVEKGLAPAYACLCKKAADRKNWRLGDDWAWFGFLRDMENGRLQAALTAVGTRPGAAELAVDVDVGPAPFERGDRTRGRADWHFVYDPRSRALRLASTGGKLVLPFELGAAESLRELARLLSRATDEMPGYWINVAVAACFRPGAPSDAQDGEEFSAERLWRDVLRDLVPWVTTRSATGHGENSRKNRQREGRP